MSYANSINFDFSGYDLKPVEQLLFLHLDNLISLNSDISISILCELCNCTKPTIYSAIKKLECQGFLAVDKTKGAKSDYETFFPSFDSMVSDSSLEPDFHHLEPDFHHLEPDSHSSDVSSLDLRMKNRPKPLTKKERNRAKRRKKQGK